LWDFLQQLLNDPQQRYSNYIAWKCRDTGVFKIVDPAGLAKLWGIQKNHLSMNYDKMSRALRYYYRVNILRKVQGERHCYQFLRNPTELKSIKNISLLRQTMANQAAAARENSANQQQQQSPAAGSQRGYVKQEAPPPQSPSFNGSIASIMSSVGHYSHLTAIPVSASRVSPVPPPPPPSTIAVAPSRLAHSPIESSAPVKMESNELETDDKPTDLSTNGDRKYADNTDCYPLIRNSNGLTTIQILRHEAEERRSPSPVRHLEPMDDMPTDLSKSEVSTSYYKQ